MFALMKVLNTRTLICSICFALTHALTRLNGRHLQMPADGLTLPRCWAMVLEAAMAEQWTLPCQRLSSCSTRASGLPTDKVWPRVAAIDLIGSFGSSLGDCWLACVCLEGHLTDRHCTMWTLCLVEARHCEGEREREELCLTVLVRTRRGRDFF